ncbi:hypothetical protein [Endomicrobium proavitum]|uniref:PQ loop repeat protein n=1 Tax=Endomicrobium proavitum TaxID=1408281 RepID=A0A0G3WIR9_9BACT|nr:hypothetical protein [Endomicrobium proavitum]AKL97785.1 conserved membrane protein of unknown function [Endomicrobium proavitum]
MSIFEIIMLLCFAFAWPFSIRKSFVSKSNAGKSVWFLIIVLVGYVAGITHKLIYNYDNVIFLYCFNFALVFTDAVLYVRNYFIQKSNNC